MTYQQTLDYLFTTLPMFSRLGAAAIKKDLTNTLLLCAHLGNPQHQFKSIHIAGTNGKGSVSHMLAAVLQTAGYKTGLYTSPHVKDFRERIRINGQMISKEEVVEFVQMMQPQIEAVQPSFFEITVAMAFHFFARAKVDIAVIEVGLGGRLDSTNVIHPELSIITNIGLDHTNMLGNTLEKIAFEKGGIIKEKVPVVIGERHPQTEAVFKTMAAEKNAPLYFAEDHFKVRDFHLHNTGMEIDLENTAQHTTGKYKLDLAGLYQTKNSITVLQAIQVLNENGWNIRDKKITKALSQVKTLTGLQGRWDVVHTSPAVVLEVAHNEDGIRQMVAHLQHLRYAHLHIIIGMVKDKERNVLLTLLPTKATYYFTAAHIPRALPSKELQAEANSFGLQGGVYENVNDALHGAINKANTDDLIIVCGSIFLVAEVDLNGTNYSIKSV